MDFLILGDSQCFHGALFLVFWWFRGLLEGLVTLEKIVILLWFFVFDCCTSFWIRDGWFMDDLIFCGIQSSLLSIIFTFFFPWDGWFMDFPISGDSTAIPW